MKYEIFCTWNAKFWGERNLNFNLDKSRQKQGNSSVAMGNWWSADVAVGQVDGFCEERFKDVERLFANQRLAQLCVFVDGKMVVGILNLKFDLWAILSDGIFSRWIFGRTEVRSLMARTPSPPSSPGRPWTWISDDQIKLCQKIIFSFQWDGPRVSCHGNAQRPRVHQVQWQVFSQTGLDCDPRFSKSPPGCTSTGLSSPTTERRFFGSDFWKAKL